MWGSARRDAVRGTTAASAVSASHLGAGHGSAHRVTLSGTATASAASTDPSRRWTEGAPRYMSHYREGRSRVTWASLYCHKGYGTAVTTLVMALARFTLFAPVLTFCTIRGKIADLDEP